MTVIYHGDGDWGTGIHELLSDVQIDTNFWTLVLAIEEKAAQGVGLVNIIQTGNQLTFVLTDHTLLGPYVISVAGIHFFGEWLPETDLVANYIITHAGSTYLVLQNHTSAMTFDPGANDGEGNDLYGLLLQNPALTIPTGGAIGAFLRKFSGADYDMYWGEAALDDLSDVVLTNPAEGEALIYVSGSWVNQTKTFVPTVGDVGDVLTLISGEVPTWLPPAVQVPPIETTASTSVDPQLVDAGTYFRCTSATDVLVTIPLNATVAFPIGTSLKFRQCSDGLVTITGESGVLINPIKNYYTITAQEGAVIEAVKVDTDEWDVFGFALVHVVPF